MLDAQTERAKRRAANRANQRVDQKVDQAVDRAAEKIEGLFRRKKENESTEESTTEEGQEQTEDEMSQEESAGFLSGLNIGGKFEPYENPVLLNLSMSYTSTNARGKESGGIMHYTLDTWQTGIVVETEGSNIRMLMDNQEGSMTMITTDDKGNISAFKMRQVSIDEEDVTPDEESYTITNLGNTRVIDGYNCTEYLIEHEGGTTNAWMTTEVDIDMQDLAKAMFSLSRQKKNSDVPPAFEMAGFPVESTTVSKNGKDTTVAHYYDIEIGEGIDKSVFDLDGVEVMSIGF